MPYFVKQENIKITPNHHGHGSFQMLGEQQGCQNGCCAGISCYHSAEYTPIAKHDDQEGFFVLSGSGSARIGKEEFSISEGTAFIVPRQTAHQLRSDDAQTPLYLFWFHAM